MARKSTLRRVRTGRRAGRQEGFIVTWDVDSADRAQAARLYRFVWGHRVEVNGRKYRYPGFVEREGVRYLGQSVLFVKPSLLAEIDRFLTNNRTDHEITPASLG